MKDRTKIKLCIIMGILQYLGFILALLLKLIWYSLFFGITTLLIFNLTFMLTYLIIEEEKTKGR